MPAVHWALENLGKEADRGKLGKRVYLVGSDYFFSRVLHILIKDLVGAHGAVVLGEGYLPPDSANMDDLVEDIAKQQPDIVFNTISGPDNDVFFKTLKKNGIVAARMPVLSFSVTEVELKGMETTPRAGHYAARNYFRTIPTHENQAFVKRFRDRFGERALLDSPAEASYINIRMWVQAALEASSGNLHKVQRTILRQSLLAPEGIVSLDPVTSHVWKVARVGKFREDGQIDVVWDSGRPLEPAPFPTYRSREEWDHLLGTIMSPQP
jgi:urea transport system substrate-binding protein